jgi:hypothetical protein
MDLILNLSLFTFFGIRLQLHTVPVFSTGEVTGNRVPAQSLNKATTDTVVTS